MITQYTVVLDRPLTEAESHAIYERMRAWLAEAARDLARTRIEPGADPRMPWTSDDTARDAPDCPYPMWELRTDDGRASGLQGELEDIVAWGYSPALVRYVPHDVRRWRNPGHRAELERRAREFAAILPGAPR